MYSYQDYVKLLKERGLLLGEYDPAKVSGLPPQFFWDRQTLVDFRGDLFIAGNNVALAQGVAIITASHSFSSGELGPTIFKRVHIEPHVFIGTRAIVYNSVLRHHSRVSIGSVVANMDVPPYTTVAGNPARVVSEYRDGKWIRKDR